MKKKIFTAIFLIISLLWVSETFAQQGRYVRKKMRPEFFIPEKALDKQETLPEFYTPDSELEPTEQVKIKRQLKKELVPIIMPELANSETENETITEPAQNEQAVAEVITITDADLADETFYVSDYLHHIDDIDLRSLPLYKQKYDEYLADLETISKTGKIPDNISLSKDLAMMKSNLKTNVDDKFGIKDEVIENTENQGINDSNF